METTCSSTSRLSHQALPPADRQVFYGSFVRDICDKYLTIFADFKIARSFFDASLAAVRLRRIPLKMLELAWHLAQPGSVCQL